MGAIARALTAPVPFPGAGRGRTFVGWGDTFTSPTNGFRLPGEQDYKKTVGDGRGTSLISAIVNWTGRELIPARPILLQRSQEKGAVPEMIFDHPYLDVARRPNPFYSGTVMRMASACSYTVDGNVYKLKIRSEERRVVGKWYLPHFCVEPVGRGSFIDYYRYTVGGVVREYAPEDIEHLRFGLNPDNPRKGMSPIGSVLREVYTDEEAARFSAALLHNLGFPGAVVIPGQGVVISKEEDRKEIKKKFDDEFGGDGRGRTIVMGANADVKFLQWSPKDLDLSSLRDVPEERVTSVTGVMAAVVGFGTGLQQVKVGATMRELRAMSWEGALIPFLELDAETDTMQSLPDFIGGPALKRTEVAWDLSRIGALSEMHLRKATTEATLVRAGIKKVDESRLALGLPPVGGAEGGFAASPGVGGGGGADAGGGAGNPAGSAAAAELEELEALAEGEGDDDDDGLTPREREAGILAGQGYANKQIGAALGISERSAERHVSNAKRKLGVESRAELGALAGRAQKTTEEKSDATATAILELARALTARGPAPAVTIEHALTDESSQKIVDGIAASTKASTVTAAELTKTVAAIVERGIEKGIDRVAERPRVRRVVREAKRAPGGAIAGTEDTLIYEDEDAADVLGRKKRKG